jgi:cellobiose transport system substrate-binding protein
MHVTAYCRTLMWRLAGGLAAAALVTGCTVVSNQPVFKRVGPLITLRVSLYGNPGYRQAGLYAEYERLHPNIRIIATDSVQQAGYWTALRAHLASGHGLADIQAIPVSGISAVTGPLAGDFVPLNTLAGAGGAATLSNEYLPWVGQLATSRAGTMYALGAEIGPIAMCYRASLLAEAGLPTSPAALARDWSTWADYLASGRRFAARIRGGPAFTDSAASVFNTMAAQASEQFYGADGRLAVAGNPALQAAWSTAAGAARQRLTAGLTPGTAAWDRGVTRDSFATTACPAWMLPQISRLSGPLGAGQWNVTAAPGKAGNAGGFYLALPRAGRHQEAAFQLASFLTGEQAGTALFRSQGDFPANFAAVNDLHSVTSGYFRGAAVGKIFGQAADRTPAAPPGPASAAIGSALDGELAGVASGRLSVSRGWQLAVRQATVAAQSPS